MGFSRRKFRLTEPSLPLKEGLISEAGRIWAFFDPDVKGS